MSALALLTGRLAPGVWRADATPLDHLVTLAEGLGWETRTGPIESVDDKVSFLDQLGAAARVPSYVRSNWDSVADGLRDLDISERCLLAIDAPHPSRFDTIAVEVLGEAAAFWAKNDRRLQVVWYGSVAAPSLGDVAPPQRSRNRSTLD